MTFGKATESEVRRNEEKKHNGNITFNFLVLHIIGNRKAKKQF